VTDTRPGLEGFFVHSARVVTGEPRAGDQVHAEVDADRREAVTRSHTATHTLHWALRDQLGQHARQQGSLVDAGRLRFDFAHFQQVPPEQLAEIEAIVNRQLLADPNIKVWHGSLAEAEAAGAISLFGEKYGSVVRVVEVGDFSRELCGGTHVGHGSQVGPVHVLGEASIGANLRRIEALTGLEALHYADRERQLLAEIAALLKTRPEDAPEQLRRRLEALAGAQRELERLRVAGLDRLAGDLAGRVAREAGGWLVVERVPEAGADDLRRIASGVRDRAGGGAGVVVLGSEVGGKAAMVALLSRELAGTGAAARDVLARAAKAVGGGAGGKGDLASAGGRDPSKLDQALGIAREDALGVLTTGGDGGSGKGSMG
jgi:alanyl-tRNA synthetase